MSKSKNTTLKICAALLLLSLPALGGATAAGKVIYVDAAAPGPVHDGASWATAYVFLQDALAEPPAYGDEIWVAAGTYQPDHGGGGQHVKHHLLGRPRLHPRRAGDGHRPGGQVELADARLLDNLARAPHVATQVVRGVVVDEEDVRVRVQSLPGRADDEGRLAAFGDGDHDVAFPHPRLGELVAPEVGKILESLHRLDQREVAAGHDADTAIFQRRHGRMPLLHVPPEPPPELLELPELFAAFAALAALNDATPSLVIHKSCSQKCNQKFNYLNSVF